MRFEINQKNFSIGDKYSVIVDGVTKYSINSSVLKFLTRFRVTDTAQREVASIKKEFSFLKANYTIDIEGIGNTKFVTNSLWRSTYTLETPNGRYEILGHKKRKFSIFLANEQVGMFQKNMISIGDGDTYLGVANDNENILLINSIVVAIDNYSSNDSDGSTITFDLGNIGPEEKPYDENWTPSV